MLYLVLRRDRPPKGPRPGHRPRLTRGGLPGKPPVAHRRLRRSPSCRPDRTSGSDLPLSPSGSGRGRRASLTLRPAFRASRLPSFAFASTPWTDQKRQPFTALPPMTALAADDALLNFLPSSRTKRMPSALLPLLNHAGDSLLSVARHQASPDCEIPIFDGHLHTPFLRLAITHSGPGQSQLGPANFVCGGAVSAGMDRPEPDA